MNKVLLSTIFIVVAISIVVSGAAVDSGSQNAAPQLTLSDPVSSAGEGPCDWLAGGPYKMHWPQPPDLSSAGVDVSGMGTVLADDFKCTASGPVSRIHLWGSFADDVLPERGAEAMTFEISIYSDILAQPNAPSRPGTPVWTRTFLPGEYAVRMVHNGPEGWYEPLKNVYQRDNHRQAYQYNFCVDKDPFVQREGTTYWLAVKVLAPANTAYKFGWKSTSPDFRWNDDAVVLATDGSWRSLTYPGSHDYAGQTLDLAFVIDSGSKLQAKYDLGDAPDSSNSLGMPMTAYPKGGPAGVAAHFPTVYRAGSPPYGPVHLDPKGTAFLGYGVTLENEADIGPDVDPTNNLDPLADVSDADGSDDGVTVPLVLPSCRTTTFNYVVTVVNPLTTRLYVNVWFDWNRDGDWDDTQTCPDGTEAPEWAVQNQLLALPGAGTYTMTTPPLRCWHPDTQGDLDPLWMRITLSDSSWTASLGAGGAGSANGYRAGETEDYYFYPKNDPAPVAYDWGDAPDGLTRAGYPTLAVHDGARHVIAGPWLGDSTGVPDAESDGQPDPNALGDDLDGNDDEEGVWIPFLVQGQTAILTVQVGGGGGVVQAWIDFNGDMTWQPGEQVFNGYLPDGLHTLAVSVPADAVVGQSFARFRISTKGGLGPQGPAPEGEVEDYDVSIFAGPPQLKEAQWPDLSPNGIDIRVDSNDGKIRWLADDFKCASSNRITEVHLWGSWKNDRKGKIQKVYLTIRPDDPVGAPGPDPQNRFSKPSPVVLWSGSFGPAEFQETPYHIVRDGGEWWWDPATGELIPGGDTEVWRLDISINPQKAFLQQGSPANPIIYWLEVRVETTDGQFGWKTRRWPDHFMDDAVWDVGADRPGAWKELRYPKSHPYYALEQNSIDMAFSLTYTAEVVEHPTTRPGSATQCPVVETRCPAVETRCPAVKTQCPTVQTRCPMTRTKCPAVSTLCPMVETRCPPVRTKCPTTATKCPVVATKCPESSTKCPPTATKCQAVDTQCPSVETRCPPVETRCPVAATKCPAVATQCPASLTKCPPTATACQTVDTQCPSLETRCPPAETRCPVAVTKCPPVATQCPVSLTKCPPVATKCQAVDTQCPSVETRCPPVATQCPVSDTKCPVTATRCPAIQTQCPSVQTQCPPMPTQCPTVSTRCPVVQTQCPTIQTQCPSVQTQCPPVNTQCPYTLTKCFFPCLLGLAASEATTLPCPAIDAICPSFVVAQR